MSDRPTLTKTPSQWSQERWDRTPLYRVVEVVRDENGRLRKEGRIWHPDLNATRRFGRAVASNSVGHRVEIADAAGDVVEQLATPGIERCQPRWEGWKDIPLPPCPPKIVRRRAPPPAMTFDPTPNPFEAGDPFDELKSALVAAGEAPAPDDSPASDPQAEADTGDGSGVVVT
jgi:hypothetical protein